MCLSISTLVSRTPYVENIFVLMDAITDVLASSLGTLRGQDVLYPVSVWNASAHQKSVFGLDQLEIKH